MTYEIFRQIDVWSTVGASVSESYKVSKNEVVKHDAPHVFFLPNALLVLLQSEQKKNLTQIFI